MEYYHGTDNENIIVFDNKQKKKKSDFGGLGIYATTLIDQAKEWSCKNSVNGVVYISEIDLNKYPLNIIYYDGNEEDFKYLCYLCRNKTEDAAKETIYNYENADIIIGPVLSNINNLYRNIKKLHGDNFSINKNKSNIKKIFFKKVTKNDTFDIIDKSIKKHHNMNQIFFKSDLAMRIFNENLKEMIYCKNDNGHINEVIRKKISFSIDENQIIKKGV